VDPCDTGTRGSSGGGRSGVAWPRRGDRPRARCRLGCARRGTAACHATGDAGPAPGPRIALPAAERLSGSDSYTASTDRRTRHFSESTGKRAANSRPATSAARRRPTTARPLSRNGAAATGEAHGVWTLSGVYPLGWPGRPPKTRTATCTGARSACCAWLPARASGCADHDGASGRPSASHTDPSRVHQPPHTSHPPQWQRSCASEDAPWSSDKQVGRSGNPWNTSERSAGAGRHPHMEPAPTDLSVSSDAP
jgi:hypothetical protein